MTKAWSKIGLHAKMLRWDRVKVADDEVPLPVVIDEVWRPERTHLDSFLEICPGWRHQDILPPTYPQVALAGAHLEVLSHRNFPYNPMGIVHVSNQIDVLKPLHISDGPFDVRVCLENWQPHRRGRLFDIRTSVFEETTLVWESTATALVMKQKKKSKAGQTSDPIAAPSLEARAGDTLHLAEDMGRRYARVAGDYNPIHQRAWMAKPFGFKRAIIHGMWTFAWAVHEPASRTEPGPMKLMGYFKRPVALPSDIWREIQGEQETDMGITIFCKPSSKPCLQISLSRVSAS
jgi:acyl dehydratase